MPTNEPIPIRAYLRDERERKIVADVFNKVRGDDARFYSGSAEGWVNEDGLKELTAQHVIVDSLAPIDPTPVSTEYIALGESTDDITLAAEPADAPSADSADEVDQIESDGDSDSDDDFDDDADITLDMGSTGDGDGSSEVEGESGAAIPEDPPEASARGPSLLGSLGDSLMNAAGDLAGKAFGILGKPQRSVLSSASESINLHMDELPSILRPTIGGIRKLVPGVKVFDDLEQTAKQYVQSRATGQGPSLLDAGEKAQPASQEDLYEVVVRLPMKVEWREALAKAGAEVTSFEPPNVFRVFLSAAELAVVKALPFIQSVERYGLAKSISPTLFRFLGLTPSEVASAGGPEAAAAVTVDRAAKASSDARPPQAFDAVLHRESDRDTAKAAITHLGGRLTAESPTVLRFEAQPEPGMLAALADRPEIKCLAPYSPPRLCSNQARLLSGVEEINKPFNGTPAGKWNGDKELVAVLDSGIDSTHKDFEGQIHKADFYTLGNQSGTADDLVGHGTHVCGIIAGNGAESGGVIRGLAPGAKLISIGIVTISFDQAILLTPPDLGDLLKEATSRGAKIINLSWGTALGGTYDQGARQLDKFVYDNPDVLVVIAAGNEGRAPKGFHEFNTVGTPASAKNAITVGACGSGHEVDRTYGAFNGDNFKDPVASMLMRDPDIPAALGSRGPTDYESVKPDVSACGVYVLAPKAANGKIGWKPAFAEHNGRYVYLGGTSMAAPVVSGLAAIVRQYLREERKTPAPSAALIKAILIASAERHAALTADQGGPFEDRVGYPDFHQGFGRVDLSRVLPNNQAAKGRKLLFDDVANNSTRALLGQSLAGGPVSGTRDYRITVPEGTTDPLRVALVWTDVPGNSVQNNLNVYVDGPQNSLFIGNAELTFKRDALFDNANLKGVPFDKRNNVEHIKINTPVAGTYTIRVAAQSTPMGQQGYALCVVGCIKEDALS